MTDEVLQTETPQGTGDVAPKEPADFPEGQVLNPQAEDSAPGVNLEDLLPKDVYGFIKMYAGILAGQAWIYLGLTFNPATQSLTKDLKQAKAAIDCLDALLVPMEGFLTAQEITEFKSLTANLKLNFIQQGKE